MASCLIAVASTTRSIVQAALQDALAGSFPGVVVRTFAPPGNNHEADILSLLAKQEHPDAKAWVGVTAIEVGVCATVTFPGNKKDLERIILRRTDGDLTAQLAHLITTTLGDK